MFINSVGSYYGYVGSNCLSEETRRRLIALGIDPSTVSSEAQAKVLIEKLLQIYAVQKSKSSDGQNNISSEAVVISKARELAKQVGASFSHSMSTEEILKAISTKIDSKPENNINSNKQDYSLCKEELVQLQFEYSQLKQNENAMFASMYYSGNVNRMMLGI